MDPLLAFGFWAYVLTVAGVYAVFVLGLQVQLGDAGLLNFGHVAFMAVGAYATGLMITNGVPMLIAIPCAVALAALFGVLIGLPTLRLRGDFFAIVTIAAGAVVTGHVVPHALMAGVPARRIGWMSRAGEKLGADLVCPRDGSRYRETEDGRLVAEEPVSRS